MSKQKWRSYLPALIAVIVFTLLSYFISFQVQENRTLGDSSNSLLLESPTSWPQFTSRSDYSINSNPESGGNGILTVLGQPSIDNDWKGTTIFKADANFTIIGIDQGREHFFLESLLLLLNSTKQNEKSNFSSSVSEGLDIRVCHRDVGISALSCQRVNGYENNDNLSISSFINGENELSHIYVNFNNGTSLLVAKLFAISPPNQNKYFFCYGLPRNVTTLKSPASWRTNACPPCICAALFSARALNWLAVPSAGGDDNNLFIEKTRFANRILKNSRFSPCLKMKANASAAIRTPSDVFLVGDSPSLGAPHAWAVRELFERSKMPLALEGGTLLGWYRNCSVVWDDVDVDFSVPSWAINQLFYKDLIQQSYFDKQSLKMDLFHGGSNSSLKLKSTRIFGDLEYGVEVRFDVQKTNAPTSVVGIDIFILYMQQPGIDYSYVQGFVTWERTIMHYALPQNLTICSTIFFGDLYLVPCEPEPYLFSHYGENWRYPKGREDGYWRSQPNIIKRIRLSESDWYRRIMFKSFENEPW